MRARIIEGISYNDLYNNFYTIHLLIYLLILGIIVMNKSILIAKKNGSISHCNQIKQCGFSLAADIHCEEVQGRQMLIDITNGRFYETNSIGKSF